MRLTVHSRNDRGEEVSETRDVATAPSAVEALMLLPLRLWVELYVIPILGPEARQAQIVRFQK